MPIYKVEGSKKDGLNKYLVRVNFMSDDGQPKQLTRTAYGSEAAKDMERRLISSIKDRRENPARGMTVQQLYEQYVSAKTHEIRETTLDKTRRNYALYVQPTLGNVRVDKLTATVLQGWKLAIEAKELSLRTRKHAYSVLRATLNYAVKMEYLPVNPLTKIGNFKDALESSAEMSIYTAQEFSQFIRMARQNAENHQSKHKDLSEWDYYVFFSIAFYCGLRKGEIHALRWSDLSGSLLHVKRSISQKLRGDDRETPPKNRSSIRTLQMPLPLIQILNEHKERQSQLPYFSEEYRICGGERCLRDSTVDKRNKLFAGLAGLKTIRIHDFRHSHVSVLANEGINIQEIARRLGHSRVEMTWNTYSHLYPREEERAVDVLNQIA
jgi:integrase